MTRFGWAEAVSMPATDNVAGPTSTPPCHAIYAFLHGEQTNASSASPRGPTTGA